MNRKCNPKDPILIVDDEEHFINSMKITLKSNDITNLECCRDSREVMKKLGERKYSLVLLDILMPGFIDGDKILPAIIAGHPGLPVIMLTGTVVEEEKKKKYLNDGAVDYLEKTMPTEQLISSIKEALIHKR